MALIRNDDACMALMTTGAYTPEQVSAIATYLDDFEVFADGFPPAKPSVAENNGVKLLLVKCPLSLEYLEGNPVELGVLFTPQFPSKPPVCALVLDASRNLELPDAPFIAKPSGVVRLPKVPHLGDTPLPPLIDILLNVTEGLAEYKVQRRAASPGNASSPAAPQPAQQSSSAPPPPGPPPGPPPAGSPSSAYAQSSSPAAAARSPTTTSSSHAQTNLPLEAQEALQRARDRAIGQYILQKAQAQKRLSELHESRDTLQKLERSMTDKQAVLNEAIKHLESAKAMLEAAKAQNPEEDDPLELLEAPDPLRRQAAELLGEVMAYEDLLGVYEKRLRKGGMSAATYMRLVGDAARNQFTAKYKLKKVHGMVTAKTSLASLQQRFPQLDPNDLVAVLTECRYSYSEASRHLSEMTAAMPK